MLYVALLRVFSKREGQIHSNFDVRSSCLHSICRRFLITQFLATKALGKSTLADRR